MNPFLKKINLQKIERKDDSDLSSMSNHRELENISNTKKRPLLAKKMLEENQVEPKITGRRGDFEVSSTGTTIFQIGDGGTWRRQFLFIYFFKKINFL